MHASSSNFSLVWAAFQEFCSSIWQKRVRLSCGYVEYVACLALIHYYHRNLPVNYRMCPHIFMTSENHRRLQTPILKISDNTMLTLVLEDVVTRDFYNAPSIYNMSLRESKAFSTSYQENLKVPYQKMRNQQPIGSQSKCRSGTKTKFYTPLFILRNAQ